MASEEIDDLVLEGHGGAIHDPSHLDDPNAGKQEALAARLKCEIIKISEEAAKARKIRVSPMVAQCVTELTMDYAEHFAKDILAFSKHGRGRPSRSRTSSSRSESYPGWKRPWRSACLKS